MRLPWSRRKNFDSNPKPIDQMWLEMLGRTSSAPVGRNQALGVPAVQRGRNLICSIATLPLEQVGPDNAVVRSPLLEQLDPDVPNVVTLSQTLEDLLFESVSWWLITAQDFAGFPVAVRHLDVGQVSMQPPIGRNPSPLPSGSDPRQGTVWVDGKPVGTDRIIRFDSPNPPVLKWAGNAIRRAILLDKAAQMYAEDPRPLDYFEPGDGADPVDDDEVKALLAQWKAARKERATAWVPASLKYSTVDTPSPQQLQLVELQRQASLDIANALGIDPEDLGISMTTRTYSNDVDRRRNKLNEVLAPYMRAITDRLYMGDVTRRGYTVRFNTTEYLLPNPTERWSTYQIAKNLGAITVDEIREAEGMPPAPADLEPVETPAEQVQDVEPVEASQPASRTFDIDSKLTFADVPLVEFSVDTENRIIEGLALPYGKVATQGGLKFRFNRGALQITDVSRIKLLRDHDTSQPLGKAIQLKDTPSGFLARFKVGRHPAGDEALQLAEDGVLDGLSVGVDFDVRSDAVDDPKNRGALLVNRADLREVSLTAMPSFDDARVTRVAASRTAEGGQVADDKAEENSVSNMIAPAVNTVATDDSDSMRAELSDVSGRVDQIKQIVEQWQEQRQTVDPTRSLNLAVTHENVPYRFDRGGNFEPGQQYDFSTDLHEMSLVNDIYGDKSDPGKRVMALLHEVFSTQRRGFVITTDIDELNPTIQRPDMYVDQRDFKYPIWTSINRGAPPNGVEPFMFPKFNTSSGLVGDHTEGTEPTGGTFTTTSQTITPTAISGKAHITREVWDMGGNPAVSTLIFNQMVRGWYEGLESAAATFLNTLTAATDINLGVAALDTTLGDNWNLAVADLQFVRSYDFEVFVVEQGLYRAFATATDETGGSGKGRPLYPMIGPMNTNGTSRTRFTALDLNGIVAIPTWSLVTTTGSPNNSWLFDPSTVFGWATTPQRLEFPGATQAGAYAPVAFVDIAIWGYKAFANVDVGGVRQVIYDPA